jgi:hypothetical protein
MESQVKESIEITDVGAPDIERIASFLERNGISGFSGNEGTVKGECFTAEYRYDPAAKLLVVQSSEPPEAIRKAPPAIAALTFKRLIQSVMTGRMMTTNTNKPNRYGIYDYVIPDITNNSGGTITYSGSNPTNGTISISNNKIDTGNTKEAFEADSSKLSGTGVGGTCDYTLADGQTVLTITYFLNTIYTHTFTAGLSGFNAPRYSTSLSGTDPTLDGYTYLNPTITLSRA